MDLLNEIINSAIGKDSKNNPKSAIVLSNEMFSLEKEDMKQVNFRSSYKTEVNIRKIGSYMMVDLIFVSNIDSDLRLIWNDLESYGNKMDGLDEESKEVPHISLTITPLIYNGTYFLVAIDPIFWTLQPQKPGGTVNTIRILFDESDFGFYESDEINTDEIDVEVEKNILAKEAEIGEMNRIEQERQSYEEERTRRIEEFRQNNID